MNVGFLHSLIQKDEKLLIDAFRNRSEIKLNLIDDRDLQFHIGHDSFDYDIVLGRNINSSRAISSLSLFESAGIRCVNTSSAAQICSDKHLSSIAIAKHNISQPEVSVAYTKDSARQAIEMMGYPVVLKPMVGSWGKLIAKINDRDAAEAILEHKSTLGSYHHSIFYIQKYVEKQGYDIRTFVIGGACVAAIHRFSNHWITNTARGGVAKKYELNDSLCDISVKAARAVGGELVAIDLFETDNGYLVNEINSRMEFKNSIEVTGVNIPELVVDYIINKRGNR